MTPLQTLRSLLRAPILTLTIIGTVGLGIGATTAIFAGIDAALLRPLPYTDPDQLVRIYTDAPPNRFRFSVADYLALQAEQTHFERIAGYTDRSMAFSNGDVAERLRGKQVSWTYFSVLGLRPVLGRDFTESDGKPGNPPAIIVSHGFWQQRLGARPDVVGKPIRFDGAEFTLAGVLPAKVGPLEQGLQFFVAAQWEVPRRKGPFFITTIARLGPGAERDSAAAELRGIVKRMFPIWKSSYQDDRATWSMIDLKAHVAGSIGTTAGLSIAAVALMWIIGCTNASNLLIARVISRRRELAVRTALGASRGRLIRLLIEESAILATSAAALGVAIAWGGIQLLRNVGPSYFQRMPEVALDGPVLAVLIGLTLLSALIFGLVPALHGTGGSVEESLRSMGRGSTGSVAVRRLRRVLVGSQFAIATPLLIVAALLLTSLSELRRVDLGFDTHNMVTGSVQLPPAQYQTPGSVTVFWTELKTRMEALPGVTGVAFADGLPPEGVGNFNNFDLEDFPTPSQQSQPVTPWVAVTPEYFRVFGLSLLEGRLLNERDVPTGQLESVVVDRAWARRFFPNGSAVGKRFKEGGCSTCPWTSVVGVVSDVKYAGLDAPDEGSVYTALSPEARFRNLVLRTDVNSPNALAAVRNVLRELDPTLPFSNVATMDELVEESLAGTESLSILIGGFAAVALALSIVGIYGVMAYYVEQHAKDITIRVALGGSSTAVLRLIVAEGMKVVSSGVGIGLLSAFAFTRLIGNLFFGVAATDVFTFVGIAILMLVVALAACVVPAQRAVAVSPADVLRRDV